MKTLSEDRRALHRIPETGCRLPETAAYLRGALAEMPCTLLAPWEDAVCAYFDFGKSETVAIRSDMVGAAAKSAAQTRAHEITTAVGTSATIELRAAGGIERSMGKAKRVVDQRRI